MRYGGNHRFGIVLAVCLLSVFVISCGRTDAGEDISDRNVKKTPDAAVVESTDAESQSDTAEEYEAADGVSAEVVRNLLCLRDGDTESLIGISFGDEFDYDKYVIRASSDEGWWYCPKDSGYDSVYFLFNGKGNGFSGLTQFAGNYFVGSHDFFGVALGEDRVETLSDVLGAYTVENKRSSGGTVTWAVWDFETAALWAEIEDGIIQTIRYLAKGDIADAPEKPEEDTDFGRDRRETKGCVEAIYNWSAYGSESEGTYAILYPGLRIGDDEEPVNYDEAAKEEFLRSYLQAQDIYKEEPDGTLYNRNGEPSVEYYVDREKGQYCFIVHMLDELYCTAYTLEDDGLFGHIICGEDPVQSGEYERLYDRNGKKMAEAAYEYVPGLPFPLVVESWNLDAAFHPDLLIRNQKTWFYMERAEFDQEGRFIAYDGRNGGSEGGEYLTGLCQTTYDADGRLTELRENPVKEDVEAAWDWWEETEDYSGWMEFGYSEGVLSYADYKRTPYIYGTTDHVGHIDYDERGRISNNDYYITHGGDSIIYLYEGDSDMPWCRMHWCSFAPGFEDIYLFLPVE